MHPLCYQTYICPQKITNTYHLSYKKNMKKINYRLVFNRKRHLNIQGKALLQVEACLGKKKVYFSTHIYLKPEQWDNKRKIIKKHPHAIELNYMILEFIIHLEQKELNIWKKGIQVTPQMLKDNPPTLKPHSVIAFIEDEIKHSPYKESTKRNKSTTLQLLKLFCNELNFNDISTQLIYNFERFLYKRGMQTNTVAKHMKHLRGFVNAAINKGEIDANSNPFQRYRIKKQAGKHSFLLPEEMQKLEDLELKGKKQSLSHTLDAFLFCCYTGLRYSDFTHLTETNITIIDKKPWIIFHTIKTGTEVKLPLHLLFEGKAWELLKKYHNKWNEFFAIKPNSWANKELIRIGKLAGISKHFSFHSARHTNATLLIHKGAPITTVQKLLGHRNISTTQIYSEVMESTMVKDLMNCR